MNIVVFWRGLNKQNRSSFEFHFCFLQRTPFRADVSSKVWPQLIDTLTKKTSHTNDDFFFARLNTIWGFEDGDTYVLAESLMIDDFELYPKVRAAHL